MQKILRFPLSGRVAVALRRLRVRARDALRVGGYRPERHYMRGPGPRAKAKAAAKPELPAR
jgi:hypothetical protein